MATVIERGEGTMTQERGVAPVGRGDKGVADQGGVATEDTVSAESTNNMPWYYNSVFATMTIQYCRNIN